MLIESRLQVFFKFLDPLFDVVNAVILQTLLRVFSNSMNSISILSASEISVTVIQTVLFLLFIFRFTLTLMRSLQM